MRPGAVAWVTAAPLWDDAARADAAQRARSMRRPALLRLRGDAFMTDLGGLLQREPRGLRDHLAVPPAAALAPAAIKLFQPAHGHFNLVAATLVCQRPGLPDHAVGAGERIAFVLRRRDAGGESALVGTGWQPVADGASVAMGEELLALFTLRYADGGASRRLFAGLVPASRGATYARPGSPAAAETARGDAPSFTIRCVYRRPGCGLRADVVSDPSDPFQIAGFADPDAPERV